jgi:hypothetical protein
LISFIFSLWLIQGIPGDVCFKVGRERRGRVDEAEEGDEGREAGERDEGREAEERDEGREAEERQKREMREERQKRER